MKCERCGNQLDDTDLFCQKCGKAVFEEYMDDDDIWDEYDREPKVGSKEKLEISKEIQPEKASKAEETKESPKEENKQEEAAKMPQIPKEESKPKRKTEAKKADKKTKKTTSKKTEEMSGKKSPVGLICACILMVCLLIGVLWGMMTVKQMEKEQATKTTADNSQEQENQASVSTDNTKTEETTKPDEAEESRPKENETKTEEQEQQPEEVEQKKQDYFVMVDKDGIDFSQYTKLTVANAEQSSMASSGNYDYSAESAADGDITSSWQEGVEGLGEGTGIKLSLDGTHKIRYIVLYLGNWRSDEMWQKNARPAKLSINLGDNQAKDVEFSDEKKAFCLSFDEPVEASFVSLYIQAGYAGAKWNDNCISEVEFYE